MPISDSRRQANRKWREANYDKICVQLPKGIRDTWKAEAEKRGISLAQLIAKAVQAYIEQSKG